MVARPRGLCRIKQPDPLDDDVQVADPGGTIPEAISAKLLI